MGGATVAVLGGVAVLNLGEFIAQFGSEENSVAVWRGMLAVLASIVAGGRSVDGAGPSQVSSAFVLILSAAAGVYLIGGYFAPAAVFLVPATLFAIRGSFDKKAIGFGRSKSSTAGPGPQRRRRAGGGNGKAPAR